MRKPCPKFSFFSLWHFLSNNISQTQNKNLAVDESNQIISQGRLVCSFPDFVCTFAIEIKQCAYVLSYFIAISLSIFNRALLEGILCKYDNQNSNKEIIFLCGKKPKRSRWQLLIIKLGIRNWPGNNKSYKLTKGKHKFDPLLNRFHQKLTFNSKL